jgi:hypothetical protein
MGGVMGLVREIPAMSRKVLVALAMGTLCASGALSGMVHGAGIEHGSRGPAVAAQATAPRSPHALPSLVRGQHGFGFQNVLGDAASYGARALLGYPCTTSASHTTWAYRQQIDRLAQLAYYQKSMGVQVNMSDPQQHARFDAWLKSTHTVDPWAINLYAGELAEVFATHCVAVS